MPVPLALSHHSRRDSLTPQRTGASLAVLAAYTTNAGPVSEAFETDSGLITHTLRMRHQVCRSTMQSHSAALRADQLLTNTSLSGIQMDPPYRPSPKGLQPLNS